MRRLDNATLDASPCDPAGPLCLVRWGCRDAIPTAPAPRAWRFSDRIVLYNLHDAAFNGTELVAVTDPEPDVETIEIYRKLPA